MHQPADQHEELVIVPFGKDTTRRGGPEAWAIWLLATAFVMWLFAIQTGYAIVSSHVEGGHQDYWMEKAL